MSASSTRPTTHTAALLASGLLLLAGFLVYGSTGHDDSHITFWAAYSLLEHGEILNYNGDRVEQSSSLLLTLLTAVISAVTTLPIITTGYLIIITCSLLALWQVARLSAAFTPHSIAATLLLGSASSFLLWTFSGMEAVLAGVCLLWLLDSWSHFLSSPEQHAARLILPTLSVLMVRPEMPLLAMALCSWLCLVPGRATRTRAFYLLSMTTVLCVALFLFRYLYFGDLFPQPVSAKANHADEWLMGIYYLLVNMAINPVVLVGTLAAGVLFLLQFAASDKNATDKQAMQSASQSQILLQLAANTLLAYLAFIVLSGGDWMQAGRFLVPTLPVACLLALYGFQRLRWRRLTQGLLASLVLAQIGLHQPVIATQSHGTPVWVQYRLNEHFRHYSVFEQYNQEHVRDMAVIDHLHTLVAELQHGKQQPVTLLSGQSGMVFYYTAQQAFRQVQFIDLRGLTDRLLDDCPVTQDIARRRQGLFWGYKEFLEHLPDLQSQCGIQAPDIIYDLNDMTQKLGQLLETRGYVLLHQEQGFVLENNTRLPWNRLLSPNMIFVRADLLPLLSQQEKRMVRYPELPLQTRIPSMPSWIPF